MNPGSKFPTSRIKYKKHKLQKTACQILWNSRIDREKCLDTSFPHFSLIFSRHCELNRETKGHALT